MCQILWNTTKVVLEGNLYLSAYIKKRRKTEKAII